MLADFCLGEKNETVLCVVKEMGVGGDVHATGAQDVTVAFMRVVMTDLNTLDAFTGEEGNEEIMMITMPEEMTRVMMRPGMNESTLINNSTKVLCK